MKETTVIIIGGGATGIGILRDLSMRGVPALLLEQGGLAHGTSSRFHGLLHSGARYAVSDSESARECIEENMILRRIGKQSVEETEGFFVRTKLDDPAFEPGWVEACARAGGRSTAAGAQSGSQYLFCLPRAGLLRRRLPSGLAQCPVCPALRR